MDPTPAQLAALRRFKAQHGRFWKSRLLDHWLHNTPLYLSDDDRALLQQVRNYYGPRWLVRNSV